MNIPISDIPVWQGTSHLWPPIEATGMMSGLPAYRVYNHDLGKESFPALGNPLARWAPDDAVELEPSSCVGEMPGVRAVGLSPVKGGKSMTVQTIVSRKGRNVVTIEPSATLEAAVATLAEHRIGAVVVLGADRRVIGILSERDIVRALAEFGADALTKRLAQVMTREVATCGEAETAVSIMERMTTGKFRHIPVVERDQLVGIVSIGDIVKHRLWVMEQESAALRDYIQSA